MIGRGVDSQGCGARRGAGTRARRSALLALVLLGALAPGPLAAQDAEDEEAQARELFIEGAHAYQAEDYDTALEAFTRSYAIRPVPVVLFNLAQTLRFLGRAAEAVDAFDRYLETEDEVPEERRVAIEDAVAELRAELAPVRLIVDTPGVEVRVGERLLGTSPFPERVWVTPGSRRFEATKENHEPATRTVELRAGEEATVRLAPQALPAEGTLVVTASVDPAVVSVGERRIGETPLELPYPAGELEVEVEAPGYRSFAEVVELADGQRLELHAELTPRLRLAEKWWFWATLGGVVVLGVVAALAATLPADTQPLEGTLPTVRALELGP
ncbi:MAG TPA: PEGA domain-containing protein [Polyangiaceae bacterium LLY-WYZ-15_(1-7)]|nr:PEGA domain-containing protein [Polyangiaceae bacterium LLY-WYZ-15_(1-7)]HJL08661.1 PEGA domain-containing protein [Polyangiaceae bacterium LLY-WYZ-15_(1-7)]HJL21554.1 PEGA domain-containing protein [Polyangiaceae bacterium LLY-WYZ-15_(1-7)]HJL50405.1 PEGA domain-containing protein [Polyangiaceae bacterium LLY-WYZ-15_(1-7)]